MESAIQQICREAGARVSTNVIVRNMDIARSSTDSRRLEVVAEGLSIFGGAQLAVDATLVSAHHCVVQTLELVARAFGSQTVRKLFGGSQSVTMSR